jgi:hypothetical protein
MQMSEVDLYAPPRTESAPREKRRARRNPFEAERRSVLLVVLLSVVTFGLYASIWYIRRTPFVNGLKSDKRLEPFLPWALLGTEIVVFVVALVAGAAEVQVDVSRPVSMVAGILAIIIRFRIAHILRSHFARSGIVMSVSGPATFFLGMLYLQWVINNAADRVASMPRSRKKSRKMPEPEFARAGN